MKKGFFIFQSNLNKILIGKTFKTFTQTINISSKIIQNYSLLNKAPIYSFSNDNVQFQIKSLTQIKNGYQYLAKKKYDLAILQLSSALDYLPKNQQKAQCAYKKQYGNLLKNLLICQLMCGKNISALKNRFQVVYKVKRLYQELVYYQSADKSQVNYSYYSKMNSDNQNWRQILKLSFLLQQSQQGKIDLSLKKINQIKDIKCKLLLFYLLIKHQKQLPMKQVQDNILSLVSIGKESDLSNISIYLFVAAQLFFKNQQYLMAQGLLNNICSQKQQNIAFPFLKFDQQYIATKILLADVYKKVKRSNQAQSLIDQYVPLFNRRKFFMQQIVKIDYENI